MTMDTPRKEKPSQSRPTSRSAAAHVTRRATPAARPSRSTGTGGSIRTCIPALRGRGGYQEPAEAEPDSHIVRGED
ncbi:hypothetical protein [Streptomyces sp. TS71-3]|uniref:hypothetical protein n=1 Tax=Streptomyces sp. TS71-3 TaxID=2733862 RepID=UPI001B201882|nr:hypothetical protein [Streptomyces sp. TS71-3]GHJ42536.1 hypothetical protein Sm713_81450 [Streptomyces sp. TS71-3]